VLFILVDDLGRETVGAWGHPFAAPTPNIDQLAADGIRFDSAHVYPFCSPTRAALLTGQQATRTGMGAITNGQRHHLRPEAPSIARFAAEAGYATSMIGKWHLSAVDDWDHPGQFGWDWFAGTMLNPQDHSKRLNQKTNYFRFEKNVNGTPVVVNKYLTTDTTDDALARMKAMPEPWFAWVAFNAPHTPTDLPPAALHTRDFATKSAPKNYVHRAVIEALDTELGRLLESMDPAVRARTTIILLSDNGSPGHRVMPPYRFDRVKGKLTDLGTRVPMIVAGAGVSQRGVSTDVVVQPWDLLPTFAEIAGVELEAIRRPDGKSYVFDGRSFWPWVVNPSLAGDRQYAFSEQFNQNGPPPHRRYDEQSVRDDRYRLIRSRKGAPKRRPEQFFEYGPDGWSEGDNLLPKLSEEQKSAHRRLRATLAEHYDAVEYSDYGVKQGPKQPKRPVPERPDPEPIRGVTMGVAKARSASSAESGETSADRGRSTTQKDGER
jgi:arylsulfatase A-like enzyme